MVSDTMRYLIVRKHTEMCASSCEASTRFWSKVLQLRDHVQPSKKDLLWQDAHDAWYRGADARVLKHLLDEHVRIWLRCRAACQKELAERIG